MRLFVPAYVMKKLYYYIPYSGQVSSLVSGISPVYKMYQLIIVYYMANLAVRYTNQRSLCRSQAYTHGGLHVATGTASGVKLWGHWDNSWSRLCGCCKGY